MYNIPQDRLFLTIRQTIDFNKEEKGKKIENCRRIKIQVTATSSVYQVGKSNEKHA